MLIIFFITFGPFGAFLSYCFEFVVVRIVGGYLVDLVIAINAPIWIIALVRDAVVGGAGMVIAFLPQIVLLFVCLGVLEQTGYLARVARVFDKFFSKVGLSGQSAFTLLMGFGCTTTAIPTVKNIENKSVRIKTAILTPYMSCSAKLPVYVVLGGAFFGAGNWVLVFGLYLLGVAVAMLLAWIMDKLLLRSVANCHCETDLILLQTKQSQRLVLLSEGLLRLPVSVGRTRNDSVPPYKLPSIKAVAKSAADAARHFTERVGTVVLSLTVLVWVLQNFTFGFVYISDPDLEISMLQQIGMILAPVFVPLGWGNWGAVSAMLCGLVAKEAIVSCLGVLSVSFTPEAVVSFLVFVLLSIPCIAAIVSLRRQVGKQLAWVAMGIQFAAAYLFSFLSYKIACAAFNGDFAGLLFAAFIILLVTVAVFMLITRHKCTNCGKCKNSPLR
ncbi:MAG: hypothetical protein FWE53_03555 [Firmicutes bacterium]|nr:hypothetical protein [Bacillota bacterium]